ncbi:MAG: hypothetical protein SPK90_00720 [Bacteroidales bacterium]|nr:hypothetical protein [Bacteroidales bacterium]MDY6405916.1 hypothetical protein [Bacteroidales bacterium]
MNRHKATILSRVLPIVFWTLAVAGSVGIPFLLSALEVQSPDFNENYWWGFAVSALVMAVIGILQKLDRHEIAIQEAFSSSLLLGIASFWLPTVLFLTIPIIFFLVYRNHFSFRSFTAMIIGFSTVAIWATVAILLGWIPNNWAIFFSPTIAWGWIPLGSILLAWLGSTIVRQSLRVR